MFGIPKVNTALVQSQSSLNLHCFKSGSLNCAILYPKTITQSLSFTSHWRKEILQKQNAKQEHLFSFFQMTDKPGKEKWREQHYIQQQFRANTGQRTENFRLALDGTIPTAWGLITQRGICVCALKKHMRKNVIAYSGSGCRNPFFERSHF